MYPHLFIFTCALCTMLCTETGSFGSDAACKLSSNEIKLSRCMKSIMVAIVCNAIDKNIICKKYTSDLNCNPDGESHWPPACNMSVQ